MRFNKVIDCLPYHFTEPPPTPTHKDVTANILKAETASLPESIEEDMVQTTTPLIASALSSVASGGSNIIHRSPSITSYEKVFSLITLRYLNFRLF